MCGKAGLGGVAFSVIGYLCLSAGATSARQTGYDAGTFTFLGALSTGAAVVMFGLQIKDYLDEKEKTKQIIKDNGVTADSFVGITVIGNEKQPTDMPFQLR